MPALAFADINTATNKSKSGQQSDKKSSVIAEISVTTRIDYILRFSQQVVLVVAEQVEEYSAIARQFLVTRSREHSSDTDIENHSTQKQCNVAFLSASIKLNDIQIRCRLIEQLFGNSLFDPEQSLAVSVLRLAKQQNEEISIVVEHAQALSLQVKYELCQLVSIAKKNQQVINVVMFAQPQAAAEVELNKTIFKDKLAIVDALSGQLYNSKSINRQRSNDGKTLQPWHKIVLLFSITLMILVSFSLVYYLQTEEGAIYLSDSSTVDKSKGFVTNSFVKIDEKLHNIEQANLVKNINSKIFPLANVQEIHNALISTESIENADKLAAQTNDVLSALVPKGLIEERQDKASNSTLIEKNDSEYNHTDNETLFEEENADFLNARYYLNFSEDPQAVVIQIAGFSDRQHWNEFLSLYPNQEFYSYQKTLNGELFTVITSKVYSDRLAAKTAMQDLPEAIIERELWLKSISTVITEINTFTE